MNRAMSDAARQRVVGIVGRPNVGKSALFNRLVGRRVAIVHEEEGITRDRIVCEAKWGEERFDVVDTGGLGVMDQAAPSDQIAAATLRQARLAIDEAAVLIQVVDIAAGLHPLDIEVARLLHEKGRPALIAANKADHAGLEVHAADFEGLGFPVFPVSALHNRGLEPLMQEVLARLPPPREQDLPPPLKIAIVGRPNVGKSSFINSLLGCERVIVSDVPGTTRDSVEVPFSIGVGPNARRYLLVDTAGWRAARKAKTPVEKFSLMRTRESVRRADLVLLMIDAVQGPGEQDKRAAAFVLEHHKGCLLLVNKWDLARGRGVSREEYARGLREAMPFLSFAPVLFVSAKTGYHIRETVEVLDQVAAQMRRRLGTGLLNRVLRDALERSMPPSVKGKRLKIFYATQVGQQPVAIRLFVNDPRLAPEPYRAYLVASLRAAFGLQGAPVVLRFSGRRHPKARPAK